MDVVEVHSNLAGRTGDSNGFVALGRRTNSSLKSLASVQAYSLLRLGLAAC
jgi:hypothetical protein